ncbi:MAG: C2 family cysteine protease [Gemmataceae bacterium]
MFFRSKNKSSRSAQASRPVRPLALERLEDRVTPSGTSFFPKGLYDTKETALNLGILTKDVDRNLKLDGPADWIRFRTQDLGGRNDRIFVHAEQGGSRLQLQLFDNRGNELGIAGGRPVDYTAVGLSDLPAGIYYACVTGLNKATGISYRFHVDAPVLVPTSDDQLNNNTEGTAFSLGPVGPTWVNRNAMLPPGDVDWYSFRLNQTAGSKSRVLVKAPLGWKLNWNVEVLDEQGQLVGVSSGTSPTHGVSIAGETAGTYKIHVYSDGGYGLGNYQVWLRNLSTAGSPTSTVTRLPNARLNQLVQQLSQDGQLSREDWIGSGGIFNAVEADGTVTRTEFNSLKSIIANTSLLDGPQTTFGTGSFSMYNYVYNLAGKVINGNFANATFQGQPLGNLAPGSSADQLETLVDKWFLGQDHPDAGNHPYEEVNGNPFFGPDGPQLADINQGNIGDCYFLSSVGTILSKELATAPNYIAIYNPATGEYPNGLFINNGDGTYTIKFFYQSQTNGEWIPDYVTVDQYFPTTQQGSTTEWNYANAYYDFNDSTLPIWVPMIEKAFVQENASAVWSPSTDTSAVANAYSAINGQYYGNQTLMLLTGQGGYQNVSNLSSLTFQQIVTAYQNGVGVVFGTMTKPPVDVNTGSLSNNYPLVSNHDYMMYGYNLTNQTILLRNPWGSYNLSGTYNSISPPASATETYLLIEADIAFLQTNFNGYYALNPIVS